MCSLCPAEFIPMECPPMTFQICFILWCFFTASVVFFYFLHSYSTKLYRIKNLCILRAQSEGAPMSFPGGCQLSHWTWFHYTVGSSVCYLCWADSGASPIAESYSKYRILFLNFILYYFCTFKIMSGNILKIIFFMLQHARILFFQLLGHLFMEIVGRDCPDD